ncbi:hypothetical protein PHYBOEH_007672 [Phytophthora boehmeriae]|uniref:Uncharacterized protein n=1 Tax=Phytophthora boehmeriae TaxID=109152 RepID=A0A8T1W9J0_9STRA|nr:hypothetical protein PHYBOEH_007672 [Phytophthora boehmeriae]
MGRPVGVESYTNADIQALLKCVKELLPKQPQDWDKVGALYREVHARPSDRAERYATSLKKKFRGILLNKTAGALDAEVKEARTIQVLIDSKDESSEAVAGHGFRILRRQNSESAVTNSHAVSDESPHSRRDDEAIEVESERPDLDKWHRNRRSMVRRGGRIVGSEGYSRADIQALLKCVREILPKQPQDWEVALELYRETHARPTGRAERDASSLKKKFRGMTMTKNAGTLGGELEEARAIQMSIDNKDENSETVAAHEFRIRRRQNSETFVRGNSMDGEASEDEAKCRAATPAAEHSMIQPVLRVMQPLDRLETQVPITPAPSMATTLASELPVTNSTGNAATSEGARKRRKAQRYPAHDNSEAQAIALSKDMTSAEGFLRWQLASEIAERRRLQRQVEDLHDRIDDLRDDHHAEMESLRGSLLDKVEVLRERNLSLAMENSHLHAELLTLRAAQGPPSK